MHVAFHGNSECVKVIHQLGADTRLMDTKESYSVAHLQQ